MRLISRHGDGSAHRVWLRAHITPEPWAFFVPSGEPVQEADGSTWSSAYPVVALFWPHCYYQVFLLLRARDTAYYCNVIVPPVYNALQAQVEFIDLDLDITKSSDGVRVEDQPEFDGRRPAYPSHWVDGALAARDELVCAAEAATGPFAPAVASQWRHWCSGRQIR